MDILNIFKTGEEHTKWIWMLLGISWVVDPNGFTLNGCICSNVKSIWNILCWAFREKEITGGNWKHATTPYMYCKLRIF